MYTTCNFCSLLLLDLIMIAKLYYTHTPSFPERVSFLQKIRKPMRGANLLCYPFFIALSLSTLPRSLHPPPVLASQAPCSKRSNVVEALVHHAAELTERHSFGTKFKLQNDTLSGTEGVVAKY
jgi:hypothetical protein